MREQELKEETRQRNKRMGYSPRCTICNNEFVDEIEQLREEGFTFEEIKQELGLTCSIMALSRHFKNHYPKSQRYKAKKKMELLENVREAYIKWPFLEEYFQNKEIEDLEEFNEEGGFCLDRFGICTFVRPCTVTNGDKNINDLIIREREEITEYQKSMYSFHNDTDLTNIRLKYGRMINRCLNCKNKINSERLNLLEQIVGYNFLNIPIEKQELYFNLLNFKGSASEFVENISQPQEVES